MSEAAIEATTRYVQSIGGRYNDYPMMMNSVKESVADVVAAQMEIFGSTGKAVIEK